MIDFIPAVVQFCRDSALSISPFVFCVDVNYLFFNLAVLVRIVSMLCIVTGAVRDTAMSISSVTLYSYLSFQITSDFSLAVPSRQLRYSIF